MNNSKLSRREFTRETAMLALSGVMITISGCSDSSTPSSPAPTPTTTAPPTTAPPSTADVQGNVSANHGHVATITGSELSGGNDVTIQIQGNSDHPHTVMLTATELSQIAGGQRVSKPSSQDQSHTHNVTFN